MFGDVESAINDALSTFTKVKDKPASCIEKAHVKMQKNNGKVATERTRFEEFETEKREENQKLQGAVIRANNTIKGIDRLLGGS